MKVHGKTLAALILPFLLILGCILLVGSKKARLAAAPAPTTRPTPVRTATAELGALADVRTYLARVESWQRADLAAQISARVLSIRHREGDQVRRGENLVRLDDGELQSALAEAETTCATLERNVAYREREQERDAVLAREGAIAQATADATADRLNDARGRLSAQEKRCDELRARLAYTRIVSPFDGVVTRRLADPGALATPGQPLLTVDDRSRLRVCFDVPQEDLSAVAAETPVTLRPGGEPLRLNVARLHPALNPDRTRTVEADAPPDPRLASGAYVPAEVQLRRLDQAVLIPEECLVAGPDGRMSVFTVEDGVTRVHPVEVSLVRQGMAAVTGVSPDAIVVRSTYLGWNRLAAGKRVEILR